MRLVALLLCVGCTQQNFVQLLDVSVGDHPAPNAAGPAGFSCRVDCPCVGAPSCSCHLLFERASNAARPSPLGIGLDPAFAATPAMGSAIVDLLSIEPGPNGDDPILLLVRCSKTPCVPISRQCFPLDLTLLRDAVDRDGAAASGFLLETVFEQLQVAHALVTPDAPHQELLVRMVTTTLTCAQVAQRPMRLSQWPVEDPATKWGEAIFGCGYAGPLKLDSTHGALFLGLPTLDPVNCVQQAAVCAADFDPSQAGALLGF